MKAEVDGQWHTDDTLVANRLAVGLARSIDAEHPDSVVLLLGVGAEGGKPEDDLMQVSIVMDIKQATATADALQSAVRELLAAVVPG